MGKIKRKFNYKIMQCSAATNTKSKDDDCICVKTSWKETVEELQRINFGLVRGLAYVKFEMVPFMP